MQKYSNEKRSELIKQWKASGKSSSVFCTENGINKNTFQYWKERERKSERSIGMIEITRPVNNIICENTSIHIEAGAFRITLPASTGQAGIEAILRTLWNIAC